MPGAPALAPRPRYDRLGEGGHRLQDSSWSFPERAARHVDPQQCQVRIVDSIGEPGSGVGGEQFPHLAAIGDEGRGSVELKVSARLFVLEYERHRRMTLYLPHLRRAIVGEEPESAAED